MKTIENPFADISDVQLANELKACVDKGQSKGGKLTRTQWLVVETAKRLRQDLAGGGQVTGKVTFGKDGVALLSLVPVAA